MNKPVHIGSGTQQDPWRCLRCLHRWFSTKKNSIDEQGKPIKPRYCAKCRTAAWDKPPKKK